MIRSFQALLIICVAFITGASVTVPVQAHSTGISLSNPFSFDIDLQKVSELEQSEVQNTLEVIAYGENHGGWPQMRVSVDGTSIGQVTVETATPQRFRFAMPTDNPKRITVHYTNDQYGGSRDKDRNLIVERVGFNGPNSLVLATEEGIFHPVSHPAMVTDGMMSRNGRLIFDLDTVRENSLREAHEALRSIRIETLDKRGRVLGNQAVPLGGRVQVALRMDETASRARLPIALAVDGQPVVESIATPHHDIDGLYVTSPITISPSTLRADITAGSYLTARFLGGEGDRAPSDQVQITAPPVKLISLRIDVPQGSGPEDIRSVYTDGVIGVTAKLSGISGDLSMPLELRVTRDGSPVQQARLVAWRQQDVPQTFKTSPISVKSHTNLQPLGIRVGDKISVRSGDNPWSEPVTVDARPQAIRSLRIRTVNGDGSLSSVEGENAHIRISERFVIELELEHPNSGLGRNAILIKVSPNQALPTTSTYGSRQPYYEEPITIRASEFRSVPDQPGHLRSGIIEVVEPTQSRETTQQDRTRRIWVQPNMTLRATFGALEAEATIVADNAPTEKGRLRIEAKDMFGREVAMPVRISGEKLVSHNIFANSFVDLEPGSYRIDILSEPVKYTQAIEISSGQTTAISLPSEELGRVRFTGGPDRNLIEKVDFNVYRDNGAISEGWSSTGQVRAAPSNQLILPQGEYIVWIEIKDTTGGTYHYEKRVAITASQLTQIALAETGRVRLPQVLINGTTDGVDSIQWSLRNTQQGQYISGAAPGEMIGVPVGTYEMVLSIRVADRFSWQQKLDDITVTAEREVTLPDMNLSWGTLEVTPAEASQAYPSGINVKIEAGEQNGQDLRGRIYVFGTSRRQSFMMPPGTYRATYDYLDSDSERYEIVREVIVLANGTVTAPGVTAP